MKRGEMSGKNTYVGGGEEKKKRKEKKRKMREREENCSEELAKKNRNQADEVNLGLTVRRKSTPKAKKTPAKSPKIPKDVFQLPEGWSMIENKSEKNGKKRNDKIYWSPAGTRFKSLVRVKKFVEVNKHLHDYSNEKDEKAN